MPEGVEHQSSFQIAAAQGRRVVIFPVMPEGIERQKCWCVRASELT
jgi:hypothetical protein